MDINRNRTGLEQKFYELTNKIVAECGYELYDMDYIQGSSTLRVFIMDPKTKTAVIDDCVKVDRAFNPYCETEDWIPDDFILEVSSPGVYRSLKAIDHFKLAMGEMIECRISGKLTPEQSQGLDKSDASSTKFRGELKEVNAEDFKIDFKGHDLSLSYQQLKKANLDPDFNN